MIDTDAKNAIRKNFVCLSVCLSVSLYVRYGNKNYSTDFNETWYIYSSYSWAGSINGSRAVKVNVGKTGEVTPFFKIPSRVQP